MNKKDIEKIKKYFHQYRENEDGMHYMHNEEDYFHILITFEDEVYQLDDDGEIQGIELETLKSFKRRFKSFVGMAFDYKAPEMSCQCSTDQCQTTK